MTRVSARRGPRHDRETDSARRHALPAAGLAQVQKQFRSRQTWPLCRRDTPPTGRSLELSRRTIHNLKEPAMFAIALIAIVIVAVVARLVTVVMNDRPLTGPRSHTHELDPQSTRLYRVV
jgi:hypothetical protein